MNKTALTQLKEFIENEWQSDISFSNILLRIGGKVQELLPIEREQIEEAYNKGILDYKPLGMLITTIGDDYFNKTYEQ
jgi:hypothetical protein